MARIMPSAIAKVQKCFPESNGLAITAYFCVSNELELKICRGLAKALGSAPTSAFEQDFTCNLALR
jgi:hypothetical protein